MNLNGYTFATRPLTDQKGTSSYFYSPVFPASGKHVSGRDVDGAAIQARVPWVLLSAYNSNGYRGVVANEDRGRFAISDRSIINDEVVLPLYDANGNRLAYSLEPQLPFDGTDPLQAMAWDFTKGELSLSIGAPDGSVTHVGTRPFVAQERPRADDEGHSLHRLEANGLRPPHGDGDGLDAGPLGEAVRGRRHLPVLDREADDDGDRDVPGNGLSRRHEVRPRHRLLPRRPGRRDGDGDALSRKRRDEGPVDHLLGEGDGRRDLRRRAGDAVVPPRRSGRVPRDDPREVHRRGRAPLGLRHAARRGRLPGGLSDRRPRKEGPLRRQAARARRDEEGGWVDDDGESHLQHITFPWNAGDVLLIAAEGEGSNKIEPVMTYEVKGEEKPWDSKLNSVGVSNLAIKTSNGYSPHLFPEFITDVEYYYGAAPRPGFMSRFLVGESTVKAPYWPTSPNAFGGQIGASANGDQPGDIYRLLGGVVRRPKEGAPQYAGYIASAFILPGGTNNNRVIAPGSEDVIGPLGTTARFFLVGLRPGMAYELGATFAPAVQIDPILPVKVRFVLTYPDGRTKTAEGTGDRFGSFVGAERWPLDVTGAYRYTLAAEWEGHAGGMPGLPASGGEFYVFRKDRPTGAAGLQVVLPKPALVSPTTGIRIDGTSSAKSVRYAVIMPGAVLAIGELPVESGRFVYRFDPLAVHDAVPLYDIVNNQTGKPEIGRLVHVTFFSEEKAPDGTSFHDFARVILRGGTAVTAR